MNKMFILENEGERVIQSQHVVNVSTWKGEAKDNE